jgi:cardiolipin synthase
MRKLLLYSIKNAKKSIYISTAYFIPGRKMLKALMQASKSGVNVKLLLPGKTDVKSVYYAGRRYFKRLMDANIMIYNYGGSILHSKTAVFDGCWNIIGSTNLDFQSLRRNEESNVGVLDSNFGKNMLETFHKDIQKSVMIDKTSWSKRPISQKFLEEFFSLIIKKL